MKVKVEFSKRQSKAYYTLEDEAIEALLYGGAKGGGKSVFGCWWSYLKCLQTIKQFNLAFTKYPIPLMFLGRKQSVDFNDTTLETWKSFIPEDGYELRSSDKEIVIQHAVKIQYGGFDDKNTVKKFNSAEYAFAFIDQAEELTRDDYGLLRGTFRRKINGVYLPRKILLTANPADCWLKDDFISGGPDSNAFVKALPADNPFLPASYVANLYEAFKHRPELIDAYIHGRWDIIAGFDLVIKPSWADAATTSKVKINLGRKVVVCDPARFGDDETIIYVLEDEKVIDEKIYGQKSTMETAGYMAALFQKHKADIAAVDGIGVGGGIVDRLRELKIRTLDIQSGAKPSSEEKEKKYFNQRSEMWWEVGQMFAEGEVQLHKDKTLKRQLCNVKYRMNSRGVIQVELKEDIKERMEGKSPDRADCLVMGLYSLRKISKGKHDFGRAPKKPRRTKDSYGWNKTKERLHARRA